MGDVISNIFGGGAKKVQASPVIKDVEEDESKIKKIRSALYSTGGEALGEEVLAGGVKGRNTFFGN